MRTDFPQVRRGYDPDEVTTHLGRVAEHVADLESRIQELQTQLLARQQAPDDEAGYEMVTARLADLVRTFDRDVERLRTEAETDADRILREATAEAERRDREAQAVRQQVELDAARIVSEATDQAESLREDAQREVEETLSAYRSRRDALLKDLGQIGEWLTTTSSTLTELLDGASTEEVIILEGEVERSTQP